jgi:hypothetical protein
MNRAIGLSPIDCGFEELKRKLRTKEGSGIAGLMQKAEPFTSGIFYMENWKPIVQAMAAIWVEATHREQARSYRFRIILKTISASRPAARY